MSDVEKILKGLEDRAQYEADQGNVDRVVKLDSLIKRNYDQVQQ